MIMVQAPVRQCGAGQRCRARGAAGATRTERARGREFRGVVPPEVIREWRAEGGRQPTEQGSPTSGGSGI